MMQKNNSKQDEKELIDYYNKFVDRQEEFGVNERHQSIVKRCLERGLKSNQNVLEIGCGIGTLTSILIPELSQGKLTAVDISDESIAIAKKKLGNYSNLTLIDANAVEYDFKGEQFDFIVLPDVLEHIPFEFHHTLFKRLNELLRVGGKVLIHIPNPYHSDWWRAQDRPMQIIDLSVHLPIIIENLKNTGLHITFLEIYSVWLNEGEYQFIELQKEEKYQNFTDIVIHKSFASKVKEKIQFELAKRKKK